MLSCACDQGRQLSVKYRFLLWLLAMISAVSEMTAQPGYFRVTAFGGFAQLLYGSLYVTLGRKNRSQIQSRASEIRAQPDGLMILRSRFGQLPLSCKKAAQ